MMKDYVDNVSEPPKRISEDDQDVQRDKIKMNSLYKLSISSKKSEDLKKERTEKGSIERESEGMKSTGARNKEKKSAGLESTGAGNAEIGNTEAGNAEIESTGAGNAEIENAEAGDVEKGITETQTQDKESESIETEETETAKEVLLPVIQSVHLEGQKREGFEWYSSAIEGSVTISKGTYELKEVNITVNGYQGTNESGDRIELGAAYKEFQGEEVEELVFPIVPLDYEENPHCSYTIIIDAKDEQGNQGEIFKQIIYIELEIPEISIEMETMGESIKQDDLEADDQKIGQGINQRVDRETEQERNKWTNSDIKFKLENRNARVSSELTYYVRKTGEEWMLLGEKCEYIAYCQENEVLKQEYEFKVVSQTGAESISSKERVRIDKQAIEVPEIVVLADASKSSWYMEVPEIRIDFLQDLGSRRSVQINIVSEKGVQRLHTYQLGIEESKSIAIEEEGIYSLKIQIKDEVGHSIVVEKTPILVDTKLPEVTVMSDDTKRDMKQWQNEEFHLVLNVMDEVSGIASFYYHWNDDEVIEIPIEERQKYRKEYIIPVKESSKGMDGDILYITAIDKAGNKKSVFQPVKLDKEIPSLKIEGPNYMVHIPQDTVINITMEENQYQGAEIIYEIKRKNSRDKWEESKGVFLSNASISIHSLKLEKEGEYQITLRGRDGAGNETPEEVIAFVIDKTSPEIEISGFSNYEIISEPQEVKLRIEETFYEDIEIICEINRKNIKREVKILPSKKITAAGQLTTQCLQLYEDGIYEYTLSAKDKAGNISVVHKNVILDRQPPIIRYVDELEGTYRTSFRLEHDIGEMIEDLTLKSYTVKLDGKPYDGKTEITQEGMHLFQIEVEDEAGNRTASSARFIIDRTHPQIIFSGITHKEKVEEPIILEIYLVDSLDQIKQVTVNGEKQMKGLEKKPYALSIEEEGRYLVEVEAEDLAGNHSKKSLEFSIGKKEHILSRIMGIPGEMIREAIQEVSDSLPITSPMKKKMKCVMIISAFTTVLLIIAVIKIRKAKK
jgi:hypothetical protein